MRRVQACLELIVRVAAVLTATLVAQPVVAHGLRPLSWQELQRRPPGAALTIVQADGQRIVARLLRAGADEALVVDFTGLGLSGGAEQRVVRELQAAGAPDLSAAPADDVSWRVRRVTRDETRALFVPRGRPGLGALLRAVVLAAGTIFLLMLGGIAVVGGIPST